MIAKWTDDVKVGIWVVIPLFRSYRKNFDAVKAYCLALKGCNPFIQVLSEKYDNPLEEYDPETERVVIPLFRSYRKNVVILNGDSFLMRVVIPLFRSYRKNNEDVV